MDGMNSSPTTGVIDAAVAKVQAAMSTIQNNAKAAGRGGSQSSYTTFAALCEALKPFTDAEGIAIYQGGCEGARSERLVTRLAKGGEWVEMSFPLKPSADGGQAYGAAIAFAKRWALCAMFKIVTSDDADEKRGIRDAQAMARPRGAGKPDATIVRALEAIRAAETSHEIVRQAAAARAAHPVGEGAAAVEQTVSAWFVNAFGAAKHIDRLIELREAANTVKVRGTEVREAVREAAARLEPR